MNELCCLELRFALAQNFNLSIGHAIKIFGFFLRRVLIKLRGLSTPPWLNNFPHLSDLYLASDRKHPDNYFEHKNVSAALSKEPPDTYYIELERELSIIAWKDWIQFKKKTIPYVTAKDKWGWHTQIFERFHEARGYVFLKEQNYGEVHFIQEKHNQKTPDLYGRGRQGVVLLEAKRIRDSDNENNYLVMPLEKKEMRKVVHFLPDPLKNKILGTIQRAKEQLYNYNVTGTNRRILFLSIRLDQSCATDESKKELDQFLSSFQDEIEIVSQIENEFFH